MEPGTQRWIALAAIVVVAAIGCSGGATTTAIRLEVRYDEGWVLSALEVQARDKGRNVPVAPELLVHVPEDWAGRDVELVVEGMRGEDRFAVGRTSVTPELGEVVDATVTLARLPCGAWCTEGATGCQGDGVIVCEQRDDDTCMEWSEPVGCDAGLSCSLGQCLDECVDECAEGEAECMGPGHVRVCGQADADPCLDWQPATACAEGESCSGGACVEGCRDQCEAGAVSCAGGGVRTCGDLNLDGCTEWGPVEPCGDGESCEAGACQPIAECTDECTGPSCDGLTYVQCGQYDLDPCLEPSPGTSCEPADPCREGRCTADGGCASAPRVCMDPPASECVDDATLRVYQQSGTCAAGACTYEYEDRDCPGCPACDACEGVVCETPPPAECVNGSTLRTYSGPGSCSAGECTYPYADMSCPDGCSAGSCVGWNEVASPAVHYAHFRGVHGTSADDVWVVGDGGTILHNDGSGWTVDTSPLTDDLNDVFALSTNVAWAVGESGTLLEYGGSWTEVPLTDNSGNAFDGPLSSIWASSSSDVWAGGLTSTYYGSRILYHYDGGSWSQVSAFPGMFVHGICGTSSSDVWFVGRSNIGNAREVARYNGSSFERPDLNSSDRSCSSSSSCRLNDCWAASRSSVWAVGTYGGIFHYDGTEWTKVYSGLGAYHSIEGVWGSSAHDIWAVYDDGNTSQGLLHYDGTGWERVTAPTGQYFEDIWGSSGDDIWAVGYPNTLLHYGSASMQ